MNKQEMYSKVRAHLLKQNARSLKPDGVSCLYRGPGGLMCAAGCLLPDEFYSSKIEGDGVWDGSARIAFSRAGVLTPENEALLVQLQNLHDNGPVDMWEQRLNDLAQKFNLEPK